MSQFALDNVNDQLVERVESPVINFRDTKRRGYLDDERESATRAIRSDVADTIEAQADFDGIVYGKGAGLMKQLYYLVGHGNFSAALHKYFDRFAWSNATILDLLADVQPYLPIEVDVNEWRSTWL